MSCAAPGGGDIQYYRHPAAWPDDALLEVCSKSQGRSSGPGGQHRNKVSTMVTLVHEPTGMSAQAGERRSMIENRGVALRRLRLVLASEHREVVPDGEIGSALLRSRRTKTKGRPIPIETSDPVLESLGVHLERVQPPHRYALTLSQTHKEYPAILAEVMDVICACGWKPKDAGIRLEVSASQLLRVVRHHPPALAALNRAREASGLRPLK